MAGRWNQSPSECVTQERGGKPRPVSEAQFWGGRAALMAKEAPSGIEQARAPEYAHATGSDTRL